MNDKHRVLVFPAGSEIGLEIYRSLKYSHHVEVYGASGKSDHASYVYPPGRYAEGDFYVDRADFIECFNDLLRKWQIGFIYPTHDTIACFLAEHRDELAAQVLTAPAETNRIARHKRRTYARFAAFDFVPELFSAPYRNLPFPVFLKPDDGQGGKGSCLAESADELAFHLARNPDLLVSEYLPGEELSVDCFTDRSGQLLFVGPRTRERVQMGISFRSSEVAVDVEILHIANAINDTLTLNGAWFFQIKRDRTGRHKLLEFAPRQSSTMGLYRHKGVNFALLSLFNALGVPVTVMQNDYTVQLDRCLHNRYKADLSFTRVYIDFDETLVADGKVNEYAMAFVYQCRNRGVEVVLLTKHRHDLTESLRWYGIAEQVFAHIIQLSDEQEKWRFIQPGGAIFIDNYWFDRREVRDRLGIPVFDVDGIECLLS